MNTVIDHLYPYPLQNNTSKSFQHGELSEDQCFELVSELCPGGVAAGAMEFELRPPPPSSPAFFFFPVNPMAEATILIILTLIWPLFGGRQWFLFLVTAVTSIALNMVAATGRKNGETTQSRRLGGELKRYWEMGFAVWSVWSVCLRR